MLSEEQKWKCCGSTGGWSLNKGTLMDAHFLYQPNEGGPRPSLWSEAMPWPWRSVAPAGTPGTPPPLEALQTTHAGHCEDSIQTSGSTAWLPPTFTSSWNQPSLKIYSEINWIPIHPWYSYLIKDWCMKGSDLGLTPQRFVESTLNPAVVFYPQALWGALYSFNCISQIKKKRGGERDPYKKKRFSSLNIFLREAIWLAFST